MRSMLLFAAAAAATLATPAFAQQPAQAGTIVIGSADLDLSSRSGLATLDRRIRAAVEIACGEVSDVDPAGKNRIRDCRRAAEAEAGAQRGRLLAQTGAARYAFRR